MLNYQNISQLYEHDCKSFWTTTFWLLFPNIVYDCVINNGSNFLCVECFYIKNVYLIRGGSRDFEKEGGGLHVGHHGWPTRKILDFRWSKKIFIYSESLSMKFFKSDFQKHFDKERKHSCSLQWEKNPEKNGLCFIRGCFIKLIQIIIIFLWFGNSFAAQFFLYVIKMKQEISIFISKLIYRLVMNITGIIFFYWQNMLIGRLIKVNHKRSL